MTTKIERSAPELSELLRVAKLKLEREEQRRRVEIVASGIVVQLVDSIGQDPSLETLRDTVIGLLLDGRSAAEALTAIGGMSSLGTPSGVGDLVPGDDLGKAILKGQEDISRRLALLERSTADIHALLARMVPGGRRRHEVRDGAGPLFALDALSQTSGGESEHLDTAGTSERSASRRRSDADVPKPDAKRGGPRGEGMAQRIREASSNYMETAGKAVRLGEVRIVLERNGILEGAGEHAVEDTFAKTFVRFGKDLWIRANAPFPDELPSRVGLLPRLIDYREQAQEMADKWNRTRPGGEPLVLNPRGGKA